MRVVVTGGLGFIGSHIVRKLLKRGEEVIVVDNLHTGREENLRGMTKEITLLKIPVEEFEDIEGDLDFIIHLGMYSSSPMYKENPLLVSKVVKGMIKLLEITRRKNSKLILISTSSIYNGHEPPWREDLIPKVKDFYTEARYFCERLCKLYSELYGVNCVVLRLFSVYGEGEEYKKRYANVITQMIWHGLEGKRFKIFGDGNQTRDFIYISDVVDGIMKAMRYNKEFDIFNIGTGIERSFNEVLNIIERVTGLKIDREYVKNPIKNYVYRTCADMEKSRKILNFYPRVSLEEGIKRIYRYYKKLKENGFIFVDY